MKCGVENVDGSKIRNVIPINRKQAIQFGYIQGLHKEKKIFFSGKTSGKEENISETENSVYIPVVNNDELFTIVNLTDGAICWDEGSLVYVLAPRKEAIQGGSYHYLMKAFEAIEDANPPGSVVRGKHKTIGFENNNNSRCIGNYQSVGVAANRGGKGLIFKNVKGFAGTVYEDRLKKNSRRFTQLCRRVLPKSITKSFCKAMKEVNFKLPSKNNKNEEASEIKEDEPSESEHIDDFFLSGAVGRDTYLELHTDDDSFYSGVAPYRGCDIIFGKKNGLPTSISMLLL